MYKANITPTIAGRYTVTVKMTNSYTASHPTVPTEITGSPFTVAVDSDPGKNSIETPTKNHIAGAQYTMTIQSRDADNLPIDSTFDVYSVTFVHSGGVST